MAITEADIKILKSERMQDTDDGGGRMTGVAVVDGQSNNIFPDISELDRTYGRVSLRKVFPAVLTSNTDTYYGANIIVAEPPQDEAVHAALFRLTTADAFFNTRANAKDKLESYVTLGALSPMRLVGDHYEGQRSILCYQGLTDPLPDAGAVYAVKYGTTVQYVRILRVESRTVTYYDDKGEFQRTELTIQISDPLRTNFPGGTISRYSSYVPPTVIHRTNVVEAVSYYGVAPLALAAGLGDREIRVARYKTPLVPSTQSESAMLDVRAGSVRTLTISGGARSAELAVATQSVGTAVTAETRGYTYVKQLVPKPAPKTLEVAYRSRDRWYLIYDSAGDGSLAGDGAGTINYTTGSVTVTLKDLPDIGTTIVWSWGGSTEFFQGTQADVDLPAWRHTTAHTPVAPGTVTVTWLSGGATKTATDTGAGTFTGDGTGTILYATGEVVLRPNALPDPQTTPEIEYDVYTSLTETFNDVTVTNNQAQVSLQQQPAPQPIEVRFQVARNFQHEAKIVCEGQTCEPKVTTTISGKNGATLYFDYFFSASLGTYVFNLKMTSGANGELPFGSIDFQTKTLTLPTNLPILTDYAVYETECGEQWNGTTKVTVCRHVFDHYEWNTTPVTTGALPGGKTNITVIYRTTGADQETYTEEIPAQNIVVRLAPRTTAEVVPGTVKFLLNGSTYIDIEGVMHKDPNPQTGVGTPAGTLDYQTGDATLTLWTAGTLSFTLQSLALQRYPRLDSGLVFRTAAPARPASLTLAVLARDGDLLTADADLDGDVAGDWAEGFIDVQTGSARVRFGQWVLASSLSDEEKQGWFSQNQVRQDGYVWKPRLVRLDTARYNLVVYVYLPLSADILGLDPVRLPMDGKVPIFRVGDVIVVHHTQLHHHQQSLQRANHQHRPRPPVLRQALRGRRQPGADSQVLGEPGRRNSHLD